MRQVGTGAWTGAGAKTFPRNWLKRQWSVLPSRDLGQVEGHAVKQLVGTEGVAEDSQQVQCVTPSYQYNYSGDENYFNPDLTQKKK